jgi:hypothetical protein
VRGLPPNKRLKLAGARVGRIAFPRSSASLSGSIPLRLRSLRPQLKRDPLGARQTPAGHVLCQ